MSYLKTNEMKRILFAILVVFAMMSCGSGGVVQKESVNIGYGETSREKLTYAVSSLNMNEAEKSTYSTIYDYLEGRVPGVQVTKTGAATATVIIRGINSINSSIEPLFIVDGVTVNDISNINPRDVKSVDVLKDASASIYGVRGANGVIIIRTK